jgi:hypothetical protein
MEERDEAWLEPTNGPPQCTIVCSASIAGPRQNRVQTVLARGKSWMRRSEVIHREASLASWPALEAALILGVVNHGGNTRISLQSGVFVIAFWQGRPAGGKWHVQAIPSREQLLGSQRQLAKQEPHETTAIPCL